MKSFKEYLIEASVKGKNLHMTHLEDLVFYGGVKGTRDAINSLRAVRDTLAGSSSKSLDVSIKLDGAPAVFTGIDPSDGKFFVAKKGIFNKNSKIYKSEADVKADTSGDLQKKLLVAFNEFSKLGIKGVIQGDLMFTQDDLKTETIDGEKFITFHPNTILYAVPADSPEGKQIKRAKIGIVWHTSYSGPDIQSMTSSFGVDVSKLNKTPSVWQQDAMVRDLSGTATMTKSETAKVTEKLSRAGKIFKSISSSTLKEIETHPILAQYIETYNNTLVRNRETIKNTSKHVDGLISWINDKFDKELEKRKSPAGKESVETRREELLAFFSKSNRKNLIAAFDLYVLIAEIKETLIDKMSDIGSLNTFLKTQDGFEVTGQEGYVAIDRMTNNAVKLVKRIQFSYANFSPTIKKGWDH